MRSLPWFAALLIFTVIGCGGGDSDTVAQSDSSASSGNNGGSGNGGSGADGDTGDSGYMGSGSGDSPDYMSGPPAGTEGGEEGTGASPDYMSGGDPTGGDPMGADGTGNSPDYMSGGDPTMDSEMTGGIAGVGDGMDDSPEMDSEMMGDIAGVGDGADSPEMDSGYMDGAIPGAEGDDPNDGAYMDGMMSGDPGGGMSGRRPSAPATYRDHGLALLKSGKEADAFKFLIAHNLVERENAANFAEFSWSPLLVEPRLGIRWAIGVDLTRPYEGDAKPIGSGLQRTPNAGRSRGRNRGGDGSGAGGMDGMDSGAEGMGGMDGSGADGMGMGMGGGGGARGQDPTLAKYTGDFGKMFIERLQERSASGAYGGVLRTVAAPKPANNRGGMDGGMDSGMMGMDDGMGMDSGMMGMDGSGSGDPGGKEDAAGGAKQLIPGVVMVGTDEVKSLLTKAKAEGVDVLAVFTVTVAKSVRSGIVNNDNLLRVYNVHTGEMIVAPNNARAQTPKINNQKAEMALADEKKKDMVAQALDNLFAVLDATVSLAPMPAGLTPNGVLNRARMLLAKPSTELLPVLHEMAYYESRQLMSKDHMTIAYQKLLGNERGSLLANGLGPQRQQVVATLLPNPPTLAGAQPPSQGPGGPGVGNPIPGSGPALASNPVPSSGPAPSSGDVPSSGATPSGFFQPSSGPATTSSPSLEGTWKGKDGITFVFSGNQMQMIENGSVDKSTFVIEPRDGGIVIVVKGGPRLNAEVADSQLKVHFGNDVRTYTKDAPGAAAPSTGGAPSRDAFKSGF